MATTDGRKTRIYAIGLSGAPPIRPDIAHMTPEVVAAQSKANREHLIAAGYDYRGMGIHDRGDFDEKFEKIKRELEDFQPDGYFMGFGLRVPHARMGFPPSPDRMAETVERVMSRTGAGQ
ncbi:hypothetical protein LTR10_003410 [Elasticomyces elasticus]|uniref:Uncharacterized protein n=1 Tax=Elasticomyces elasticus TaxID=574655 RepID=A0AAN7ZZ59_9PEZI|nr:hypothetical protein LTR22_021818 [Elasticomyces elasticus]KAK4960514.1 hypothetical protein LTR10_003410 [Elasticomyces elasticus]KAK4969678.1 hypothetical protein LTR42_008950 [Elasticomyces elasticus]KAK5690379.1 hypothetical protein LTR97_012247 [Elasticomyces elasticus]